jgi:hypothetical protein
MSFIPEQLPLNLSCPLYSSIVAFSSGVLFGAGLQCGSYIPSSYALNFAYLSLYSFDRPVREIPRKYLIVFGYSYHAGHGIAFSSLTGIAGGLRKIITNGYFSGVNFINLYKMFINNVCIKYTQKHIGAAFSIILLGLSFWRKIQKTAKAAIITAGEL